MVERADRDLVVMPITAGGLVDPARDRRGQWLSIRVLLAVIVSLRDLDYDRWRTLGAFVMRFATIFFVLSALLPLGGVRNIFMDLVKDAGDASFCTCSSYSRLWPTRVGWQILWGM